jgi:hypothetical protein
MREMKPRKLSPKSENLLPLLASLAIKLIVVFFLIAPDKASSEVEGCTVGDPTQGSWGLIKNRTPDSCPFPGPRAEDSLWPTSATPVHGAHRIEGRYKMMVNMCGKNSCGTNASVPSMGDNKLCITGYAEAYASASRNKYQIECDHYYGEGNCPFTYIASGNVVTTIYNNSPSGYVCYYLYYDCVYLSEWACSPSQVPVVGNNLAPSCPQGQCCE